MLRGDIYISRKDFKSGLIDYENSITLINTSKFVDKKALVLTYNALGGTQIDLYLSQANKEGKANFVYKAIENLQAAIKLDSLFPNSYFLLGNAYFHLGKYEESINTYEKCFKINAAYPSIKENLAIAYREAGKYAGEQQHNLSKALAYLEQSYNLNNKDEETLRLLGVANGISGNHEIALKWFLKATEINPSSASAWWNLGTAYGLTSNKKEMKRCRKTALKIDPEIEKKMN